MVQNLQAFNIDFFEKQENTFSQTEKSKQNTNTSPMVNSHNSGDSCN